MTHNWEVLEMTWNYNYNYNIMYKQEHVGTSKWRSPLSGAHVLLVQTMAGLQYCSYMFAEMCVTEWTYVYQRKI